MSASPIDFGDGDNGGAHALVAPNGGLPSSVYRETQAEREREAIDAAKAWDVWTPDRIYAELPPIEWIVEGVIPARSLGMICAYGSSLKSWIEIDLLDSLARGRPWLGLFPCGAPAGVFLIDYEAGNYELRRRLQSVARGSHPERQLEPTANIRFVTMPPTHLPDEDFIARLEPFARDCKVLCIDTLAAGSPGVDENDSRFAMPLNALKALAERMGCAIVALHHTRKPTDGEDERATTRGTSAIFNALDWELKLSRSRDDERLFICRCDKARGMRAPAPFTVRVDDIACDAVQVIGESLAEGVGSAKDAESAAAERKRIVTLEAEILKAVVENPISGGQRVISEVLRGRGVSFKAVDLGAAVQNLTRDRRLGNTGSDQRPRWVIGGAK